MPFDTGAPAQSDIFAAFGLNAEGKKSDAPPPANGQGDQTPPPDTDTDNATPPAADGTPTPPADGSGEADKPKEPTAPPPDDKAAKQFASMRVQLKQYENLLTDLSKLLQIPDTLDQTGRLEALKDAIIKGQSKQSGISEEIIRRQQASDAELMELRSGQHAAQMYGQFQKVMDTFKLDQDKLRDFAQELQAAGIDVFDPSNKNLDLLREYRDRHFDEILTAREKAARDAALEEERKRAEKANKHGTTPPGRQGAPAGEGGQKIETQAALSGFLDGLMK